MTGFSAVPLPHEEGDNAHQQFKGVSRILGPRWAHLPTLTIGLLGVQIFWSVEMSYGVCPFSQFNHSAAVCEPSFSLGIASPYLLSLGLTKSKVASVFIAGPLSGLIMQPLIGTFACRIFLSEHVLLTNSQVCWRTTRHHDSVVGGRTCYSDL